MNQPAKFVWGLWPCLAVALGLWILESAWAAILFYHAAFVAGLIRYPEAWKEAVRGFRWFPAIGGAIAGLAAIPAVLLLLPMLVGMPSGAAGEMLAEKMAASGLSPARFPLFFLYFVTVHPVLEELGWRSLLGTDSRKLHLIDIEFAVYHLLVLSYFFPGAWPLLVVTFLVLTGSAWLWRQMRRAYGGLASVIAFHAAADAGILIAVWRMSGLPVPGW